MKPEYLLFFYRKTLPFPVSYKNKVFCGYILIKSTDSNWFTNLLQKKLKLIYFYHIDYQIDIVYF
jgi:hypothetical protein